LFRFPFTRKVPKDCFGVCSCVNPDPERYFINGLF
jgi:hypothetical protein